MCCNRRSPYADNRTGGRVGGVAASDGTTAPSPHLHRDHIGGLREAGSEAFAKARYAVNATEYGFWISDARVGTATEGNHLQVLERVKPVAAKTTFVTNQQTIAPGITAVSAPGHSPGHMILLVDSEGRRLVVSADTVVHYAVGLQRPNWEVRFDMDKAGAAVTRQKVLDMIATDRVPFIGYHMPHPSVGFLEKRTEGYPFEPASYQFDI
ncbi:MBL fold metallo-hydrolase (plasmid) [Rhizobium sp. 007]|nr:MBL fold metallo-hydrolase [Rhizobium sp. 007]